jgi:hypothetical protein
MRIFVRRMRQPPVNPRFQNESSVHLGSEEGCYQSSEAWCRVPGSCYSFRRPDSITIADPDHSVAEERFVLIGQSDRRRLVVVGHVERGDLIRIISARLARRNTYEEEA